MLASSILNLQPYLTDLNSAEVRLHPFEGPCPEKLGRRESKRMVFALLMLERMLPMNRSVCVEGMEWHEDMNLRWRQKRKPWWLLSGKKSFLRTGGW